MSKMLDTIGVTVEVDLLDLYVQVSKSSPGDDGWDRARRWLDRVGKLKGVYETIDGHMVWIRYRVETRDYSRIEREVAELMQKIHRLHRRYVQ